MHTFYVTPGSWHHRLVTAYADKLPAQDICSYSRQVLLGLIIAVFITLLIGLYAAGVIDFLMWLWFFISGYKIDLHFGGMMVSVFTLALIVLIGGSLLLDWLNKRKPHKPGFVGQAWTSFHDKVCFRVEVKNEDANTKI